jgi:hypothetical protein
VLGPREVVFTIMVRDDATVSVRSRALNGDQILVRLDLGEPTGTENDGLTWEIRWAFAYKGERQARVVATHTRVGGARSQAWRTLGSQRAIRSSIASRAGWRMAG